MIYVDPPTWKKQNGRKQYSHMVADTLEELHLFAQLLGVKQHFFHRAKSGWHYDITADQYACAISKGALLVSSRVILLKARALCQTKKQI